jgi:NAD(P)-dependent dehydrogenase (short-subunit alcohol dehydrogenase family)
MMMSRTAADGSPSHMDMLALRLKGTVALIAGGTEEVSKGIVRTFLRAGAVVVVPSSSAEQLERLREELQEFPVGDLVTIFGDVGRPDEAKRIREVMIGRVGRLDAIVASLGRWRHAQPLVDLSLESWEDTLRENLTAHFAVIHTFIPLLRAQGYGSYTFLKHIDPTGSAGHANKSPVTGSSQEMLVCALAEELADTRVRINEVTVCRDSAMENSRADSPGRSFSDAVGMFTAWLASAGGASVRGATIRSVVRPFTAT